MAHAGGVGADRRQAEVMMTEAEAIERLERIARLKAQLDRAGDKSPTSVLRHALEREYQALDPDNIPPHIMARYEEAEHMIETDLTSVIVCPVCEGHRAWQGKKKGRIACSYCLGSGAVDNKDGQAAGLQSYNIELRGLNDGEWPL